MTARPSSGVFGLFAWHRNLDDPNASRWYDADGNPTEATGTIARLATEHDYYRVILPAIRRLESLLSAEAKPEDLLPVKSSAGPCWELRTKE
jgi:hypothetical protein